MSEILVPIAFWLVVLFPIGAFIWQFRRVRRGILSKSKGTVFFFGYSMVPVALYAVIFFLLVGAEELTHIPLISEGYARTFILVVGIGVMLVLFMTGLFATLMALHKHKEMSNREHS